MQQRQWLRHTLVAAAAAATLGATATAGAATDAAFVNARTKFFGAENVDPKTGAVKKDKVVLSWLTHTTMAAAIHGRVILMDSYITPLETRPGRTPFVIKDVVDLKPEAIFIGHGHGDHADNAAFIAARAGSKLYASEETCADLQGDLARMKADPFIQADPDFAIPQDRSISCTPVTTTGSVPGTQVIRISQLEPLACIVAYRHLHSVAVPLDPVWGPQPVVDTPDPRDAELFPRGVPLRPSEPRQLGQQNIRASASPAGGTTSLFFHFITRSGYNFHIANNNSVGAIKEGKGRNWLQGTPADGQRLMDLWRALPPTDLHIGTSDSGNITENGWRDHVYLFSALKPKIFMPTHAPVATAMQYYAGMKKQLELMEQPRGDWPGFPRDQWPRLHWLIDPTDLMKPVVFQPGDPAWYSPDKAAKVQQFCG